MSFVPVTGTATFRAAEPPRDGVVEFTDERRTVALPIRAALPVLTKAHSRDDLHPSVGLLSGAALLGLRLVAAGQIEPAGSEPSWRMGPLAADDEDRVLRLAAARAHDGLPADAAEDVVRAVLDAVADAMPRAAPTAQRRPAVTRPQFEHRLRERLRRYAEPRPELPQLVRISLRVEADEEELVAGSVRLVLQVHDEQNPLHLCDAAVLWTADAARRTASATGRGPMPRSRSAGRPRPGPCSTGCSSCGSPTRSPSTATSSRACSSTAWPPWPPGGSTCSGRGAWAAS